MATSSATPVMRDTLRTSTEFVDVLYMCILFVIHPVVTYIIVLVHFPVTSLCPFRAFDVHEIYIFGDLLLC